MNARRFSACVASMVLLGIAGCGGGGDDTSAVPANPPTGGIQGSGIAFGAVTGFGSIFVNGVEFATANATIRIDGQPGTEAQLSVGHVVLVRGGAVSGGRSTATEVRFDDNVEGPIAALDAPAGTFVVLGQTVRVTGATLFDDSISPASIQGLAVGMTVEVSGFADANGVTSATRIERKTAGELEVTGIVSNLDAGASTFRINALVVEFAGVTPRDGTLANGVTVEVKGTTVTPSGALRATSIEVKQGFGAQNGQFGEVEGLITRFASASDFDVGGQRVTTDAATQFELNGLTLGLNVKVEVEGSFNTANVLVARRVELERDASSRVLSTIDSIDAAANTVRVDLGVTISFDAATQFEDKLDQPQRPFRFADLRVGDYVEVRGFENPASDRLNAVLLERERPDTDVELRGLARNVSDPNVTILGVNNALGAAGVEFRDEADVPISRAEFFSRAPNRVVKLSGSVSPAGIVSWEEAELEN